MEILEALATLDVENDEQWTSDGLPKVDVVSELTENDKLKRADIMAAAPEYTRAFAADPANLSIDPNEAAGPSPGDEGEEELKEEELSEEDQLAGELSSLQAELGILGKQINAMENTRRDLARQVGTVGGRLDRIRSNRPQNDVQQYLASQTRLREERAVRLMQLNETGIKELLKSVAKSPLDAAMSQRKPGRGTQRPVFSQPKTI